MKKFSISFFAALAVLFMVLSTNVFATEIDAKSDDTMGVTYRTHIENEGWTQGWMSDGALSGSEGKGYRLEAIEIELTGDVPEGLGIQYQTHIQNNGWSQGWVADGEISGSEGQGLRLEAIEIKLTGTDASDYSVKYRTHIQNDGWSQGWVADGTLSGSEGKGLRLEAIEIVVEETPVKIAYDAYLATLAQVNEEDYTLVTWKAYQTVVAANVVTKEDIANKITEATAAIEAAQADLVKKADLTTYYDVLDNVTESQCTPESWAVYQAIVEANVVTVENTQAVVDTATIAILKAQNDLVKYSDMTDYDAALAAVSEDQVKSGWAAYKAVVDANVVTNLDTQEEVDLATANILAAQKNLVFYSDLTAFNTAIELYVEYGGDADDAPYTTASWNAYTAKCETYGTLTNGVWSYDVVTKNSEQSIIDAAAVDIQSYIDKLVSAADLTEFNAAKNIQITDGPYTTASFAAYTSDAQVISITSIAGDVLKSYAQNVVDSYTNTLVAIQESLLVKGADLSEYNEALAEVTQANYTTISWTAYQVIVTANVVTVDSPQKTVDIVTAKIISAQKSLVFSAAYVKTNAKINTSNFGVQNVGDNILTRANELITSAGLDATDYTVTFTRVDEGTAGINATTGLITEIGESTAKVYFTITPNDGSEAAITANVDILINP